MARVKKVPQRTCVGCQAVRSKRELVRVVRTPDGSICLDSTGKKSGRGAYLCPDVACLNAALKGKRLEKVLETALTQELTEELRTRMGLTKPEQTDCSEGVDG